MIQHSWNRIFENRLFWLIFILFFVNFRIFVFVCVFMQNSRVARGSQNIYKTCPQMTLERENVAKQLYGLLLFDIFALNTLQKFIYVPWTPLSVWNSALVLKGLWPPTLLPAKKRKIHLFQKHQGKLLRRLCLLIPCGISVEWVLLRGTPRY